MSRINKSIIAGILVSGTQAAMVRAEESAAPKPVPPPAAREANPTLPGLVYHPEGDAIVVRNGTRWDNRPLYCNARKMVVYAGEMPGLSCELGKLRVAVRRGDVNLQFDQFSERVMRYRPGRMEWEVRDPQLPGLTVTMMATTVAEGDGFTILKFGWPDKFIPQGKPDILMQECGLSPQAVADAISMELGK